MYIGPCVDDCCPPQTHSFPRDWYTFRQEHVTSSSCINIAYYLRSRHTSWPQIKMPATTSRSPSPATDPPIAAAPGPRASALQKLYADAIAHTVKTCNYNNFASCFPTPAKHAPEAMKELHSDFIQKLHHSCKASPSRPAPYYSANWLIQENFDIVLRDRDVVASLNDLDRLVEDARRRRAKAQEAAAGQPVQQPVPYVLYLNLLHCHSILTYVNPVRILCRPPHSATRIWLLHCLNRRPSSIRDCRTSSPRMCDSYKPSSNNAARLRASWPALKRSLLTLMLLIMPSRQKT